MARERALERDDHQLAVGPVLGVGGRAQPAALAREHQHGVLEPAAGPEERDPLSERDPCSPHRAVGAAVRAAGHDPDPVEPLQRGVFGVLRRDPVRVEHEPVPRGERVDQARDARVGAHGGRAVAHEREGGDRHGRHLREGRRSRPTIVRGLIIRDTDAGWTRVTSARSPWSRSAPRSRRPRASSATRSRPSPSTSRRSRRTSAPRCCGAARSRRPRPEPACSSTRARSCCGSTRPAPT